MPNRRLTPTRLPEAGPLPTPAPDAVALPAPRPLILVVDDEDGVRTLTVKLLERCGYRATGAGDGVEALRTLRARHAEVACVVLDLTMPRMGGEEVLRELRTFAPALPVLISSGAEGEDVNRRLAALNVSGFIQKPYQLAALRARVESILAATKG